MAVTSRFLAIGALSAAVSLAGARPAAAQTQTASGPLVLTPNESTLVVTPVAKATRLDGRTSGLAGLFVGHTFEDTATVGVAGYGLAAPTNGTHLWYAGVVGSWKTLSAGPFSLRPQILAGGGHGSRLVTTTLPVRGPFGHGPFPTEPSGTFQFRAGGAFFIAEPEMTMQVKLFERLRLNLGAGYRYTTLAYGFGNGLRGPTGTLGFEIAFPGKDK